MKYSLVIFDLDGTILETLEDLADSCNFVLAQHGLPLHSYEEIKFMVGNGIPKLIERACPADIDRREYEKVLADYLEYYADHCNIKTAPYEGMVNLVKNLKKAGIKVAVNTNKREEASITLCNQYFPGLFDAVVGNFGDRPVKPAPDGVFEILKKLGLSPSDGVVFIGDSDVDIKTGLNAGIDAIGVEWGFRGREFLLEHGAKVVVKDCKELESLILE